MAHKSQTKRTFS